MSGGDAVGVSRRRLLKGAAAGAGLAALTPQFRSYASTSHGSTVRPRFAPGDRPYPNLPAGVDTIPQVQHVVVLMMENHSFDNHFGALRRPGLDGLTFRDGYATNSNPSPDGETVYAAPAPSTCQANYKISQSWDASHRSWDYGANNGFVAQCGPESMYYYTEEQIPFYYGLASYFPVCDRYFCSVMAQTYPNRRFLIAGSAFGLVGDPFPTIVGSTSPRPGGFGTVFDMLNAFGISWKDYFVDLPTAGLFPYVVEQNPDKVVSVADFFADCAAGTLPFFSLVDPESFEGSEENPQDAQSGAYYAYQVIDAVMSSPNWPSTVLVLTFDEHGGYYDHVPPVPAVRPDGIPPAVGSDTYGDLYTWTGFRVPTVVVSPWARANYVSHTVYDHTSILRLVETKWNLPALSYRDANANNMLDCLDLRAPAFLVPPVLASAPVPTGVPECVAQDPTGQ
ncbi:MAG TPA: alkaline phosphatase family protein [Acidimicrobiales bacterium]|nr:alkaline phosphatase family protein [Acidimicrobiales bacterium]